MKRIHIHVGVENLEQSIKFYKALFGVEPIKVKGDYAKWLLDDPRLNFAISTRVSAGVDHLGMQVEEESELSNLRERFKAADLITFDESETTCCYARADKSWLKDPSGVAWENYRAMEDTQVFGVSSSKLGEACCAS